MTPQLNSHATDIVIADWCGTAIGWCCPSRNTNMKTKHSCGVLARRATISFLDVTELGDLEGSLRANLFADSMGTF